MGVSTDAILFYGYCWDEETSLFADDSVEWPELVLRKRGVRNPWDDFPAELNGSPRPNESWDERKAKIDAWSATRRAEIDAWYAQKKAVEQEFGVYVGSHCSGDCSMPYLAVHGVTASRGYPKRIEDLEVGADWDERLDRFCAEFAIAKPRATPGWWLVSYWSQ